MSTSATTRASSTVPSSAEVAIAEVTDAITPPVLPGAGGKRTRVRRHGPISPLRRVLIYVMLTVLTAIIFVPFFWMVSSSLKQNNEVFSIPVQWIPTEFVWQNYVDIWTRIPMLTYLKNSLFLSVTITILQVLTGSFAAYGFSKMHFKGRDVLFVAYIATIAVPWQAYMIPQYIMMQNAGLVNTHLSIILLQAFGAFGVFLMRQYYLTIPDELSEAARIDGLNEYAIWWRIILPLTKPALASLALLTFVSTWNDYMGPFIYLTSNDLWTVQLGLRSFVGQYDAEYALIMAGSVVSVIPIVLIFLLGQRYFIQGIATSGMKG
ncbi:carbohydrate ABC transporter permease [Plantibacter sp. VKM Ac-2885]|uniref:carbohydrate ABC transporter permease n=1 Tax=Plantibacter TaxID=190323 RepID=UPI0010C1E8E8|nr:carbohydrate ABC transporter permease [Plantibacter sp. CFBP 8775]MBF4511704.1 carbohydrate ABC transporter permease [Plantibacter sp. VKM Ac-2885]MBF4563812.1 carbohydrate ABC transporter permease [Plantibacter sp. VKM Ac-2876]TKJ99306.1 sugar ABC transporter ATP-binding protein [Plantibacter flavus]